MRSFTIHTDRVGAKRWCWVRVHDTVEELRRAAYRTRPQHGADWWAECCGCFHPTTHDTDEATGVQHYPRNGFAGTLRLAKGLDHLGDRGP